MQDSGKIKYNATRQFFCPISTEKVNEHVVRLNAFFSLLILLAGSYFNETALFIFLLVDFATRVFFDLKYSPVSLVSKGLNSILRLGEKPIDKAPKIFAARVGFLMVLIATTIQVLGFDVGATVVATVLVLFFSFESLLRFCVGCLIYSIIEHSFYRR